MSKYLTQVWQGEQKKMDAFFEGMDAKIAAATIAAQAARIAELEAALKKADDMFFLSLRGKLNNDEIVEHFRATRALLAKKG